MASATRITRTSGMALLTMLAIAGCASGRAWQPFGPPAAPALSKNATAAEVVAHLNANIERCSGWQAHNVKVESNGFLLPANATVAVESPRNFRMLVSAMNVDLADLGSNQERMWFWVRMPEKQSPGGQYAYTCTHADLPAAQAKMGLPFRPNWLMEVMGVMPIDPNSVTMRSDPANEGLILLESELPSTTGQSLTRRITVDAQSGTIVSHALADAATDQILAEARMSDHQPDPETGVLLPHRITLAYPEMDFELTMTFTEDIAVNPTSFAATTWQPTVASAYPFMDILTRSIVTLDPSAPAVEQVAAPGTAVPWNPETD